MNRQNFQLLHRAIQETSSFSMSRVHHPCGTPGCIYGHVCALRVNAAITESLPANTYSDVLARRWLDVDYWDADILFFPDDEKWRWTSPPNHPGYISQEHAIHALEVILDTGRIPQDLWDLAYERLQEKQMIPTSPSAVMTSSEELYIDINNAIIRIIRNARDRDTILKCLSVHDAMVCLWRDEMDDYDYVVTILYQLSNRVKNPRYKGDLRHLADRFHDKINHEQ